jgi:glycine oxidase
MTKTFDIAIIGGGVIGLTLARALIRRGASLALFDAGAVIPPATNAAAGMLAPSFEHGEGGGALYDALHRFGARALSLWPGYAAALEEETGVRIDYRGDGVLGVAFTENEAKELREQAVRTSSLGGDVSMISGDEARAMEPALSKDIVAALWAPRDAQVDPRRLLIALRAAVKKKVVQHFPEKVARIVVQAAGASCTTKSGETVAAREIVLAGGAVSGLASKELVFPVKGDAVAVEIEEGAVTRVIRAPGAYLCPKAGGRLVIGASEERGRDDLSVDAEAIDALKSGATQAVPTLGQAREIERWTGLRPGTPDGAPILGRAGNGVYLALGHYRNGVLHAPASAEDMAALILDGRTSDDLQSFNPSRFGALAMAEHG